MTYSYTIVSSSNSHGARRRTPEFGLLTLQLSSTTTAPPGPICAPAICPAWICAASLASMPLCHKQSQSVSPAYCILGFQLRGGKGCEDPKQLAPHSSQAQLSSRPAPDPTEVLTYVAKGLVLLSYSDRGPRSLPHLQLMIHARANSSSALTVRNASPTPFLRSTSFWLMIS